MEWGHTFARENCSYQIGTYQCVSYLCDNDNFILNLGLYLAFYLFKYISLHYGHINVCYLDFSLLKFGLIFATKLRLCFA